MGDLTIEKIQAIRSEYNRRHVRENKSRQKIKPGYIDMYPWIQPDEQDPYFVFCRVCECRLTAKGSDLGKHEGSLKHSQNMAKKMIPGQISVVNSPTLQSNNDSNGWKIEPNDSYVPEEDSMDGNLQMEPQINLTEENDELTLENQTESSTDTTNNNDDYDYMYENTSESSDKTASERAHIPKITVASLKSLTHPLSNGSSPSSNTGLPPTSCKITIKKVTGAPATLPNPIKTTATITPVLTPIGSNNLTYGVVQPPYNPSVGSGSPGTNVYTTNQLQTGLKSPCHSSYDLFFQSVCETVKSFPPRLALEGKLRIMQIIGELEEKAIAERENNNK